MSASLTIDVRNTCDFRPSVGVGSGSNLVVGEIVDLQNSDTLCNIFVAGAQGGSGAIQVFVQSSDSTASGTFTDPTSGIPNGSFPSVLLSGGIFITNSGLWVSGNQSESAPVNNAPLFCSGGIDFAFFQRPQRYVRLILNSGPYPNAITAGFLSNKRTTGSGGGFTFNPTSGVVSV